MPMKLKAIRKKTMTWFETPTAATAPSETWLTMNVSTVPISIRSVCSINIGHAIAIRPFWAWVVWVIGWAREHSRGRRQGVNRSWGLCFAGIRSTVAP